ncbi:hypothetical protein [Cytobacillus purgationiresistens]|uniref:MinD-like ATPase involved in chromosome partitioning or flagellar assembly n=1 Tax=Cytobacillus purgationiresistens TaxID=863449 RepID=A0ABU0AIX5_9BACI|nr:hypothetical protein [Cytobacillus purgationiresistens]MDQ0271213.1 MinD-like ATPase involved in chromosome partitioning or flagellar assembly [Cytobacillus purgationiresistens]
MSIISFWGPIQGQVSTTSNLIAASLILALDKENKKTIITQTEWSKSTLEYAFLKEENENDIFTFSDSGIDALERMAKSHRLTSEKLMDYTKAILRNRLDLLTGSTKTNKEMFEGMSGILEMVLSLSKDCYDYTLVDLPRGSANSMTKKTLQNSDLIVVNLNQNIHVLESFFKKKDNLEILEGKPYIIVLSQYDPESRFSVKNIQRRYKIKQPIYTIPYNTDFRDTMNQQNVTEFFLRAKNFKKGHQNFYFISEIRRLAAGIDRALNTSHKDLLREVL